MTLFRSIGKRRQAPARLPAPQLSPDMPPRSASYRSLGPDTTPKLALGLGPVDPLYDPCGAPPLENGGPS